MATATKLDQEKSGKKVNITNYRGMMGSLLYLTASHPDIIFATCLCARFQADLKDSHLIAVKRIFSFDLIGYTDSDYAGCKIDRKSTSRSYQFLKGKLVSWFRKKHHSVSTSTAKAEYIVVGSCCSQILDEKSTPRLWT
ncbi:secreted RxLR effector protein 161-like [Apium graveolens]|uniref:secreted RxLR effector protein 161-like n=1 Tax=Apium graveolens TaxID=4045 RepID=UPI003D78EFD6